MVYLKFVILCSLSVPFVAQAFFPSMKSSIPSRIVPTSQVKASCIDFSGKWVGQCRNKYGEKTPSVAEIEQWNCDSLQFTQLGQMYLIGGQNTKGSTSAQMTNQLVLELDWNQDRNELIGALTGHGRDLTTDFKWNTTGSISYKIQDNKLVVLFSSKMMGSGGSEVITRDECYFEKK